MNSTVGSLVVALTLVLAGCARHEIAETSDTQTVDAAGAESARVDVELGAGELRMDAGSARLMDADFRYVEGNRPVVKYDVTGRRGLLTLRQPPHTFDGHGRNSWDLHLTDRLPLDLRVKLGAGQGKLKAVGLDVRSLDIEMGAGELELDLNGPWDKDMDARIRGGVGEVTVRLPKKAGVRVKATGGIGEIKVQGLENRDGYYYNEAYGKSDVKLRIDVSGGIGQINIIG